MKNFIFVLCFILSSQSFAQSLDASTSLDANFAEQRQLTDQQNDESQKFIHKGIQDRKVQEGCDNKTLKDCDPSSASNMGVLLPGAIEDKIGMLYALMFGGMSIMSGGAKLNAKVPKPEGENTSPEGDGKDGKTDYCIYIPTVYEGVSFLMQSAGQKQAQQDTANLDPQLAALAQLKETHKTRKKTATQQSVVYATTAGCYAAMGTMGGAAMDKKLIIRMVAAGGLSALYMAKAKKHGNAAEKVQAVIDSLPKAGDCNPWTGTSCFCAEKSSAKLYPGQFKEVCVLNGGNFAGTKSDFGCAVNVGGKLSLDASCSCRKTNTCLNSKITFGRGGLGLGANLVNSANQGLGLLDPSKFDEASLNAFQSGMAAKLADLKLKSKEPIPNVKLNPTQKAVADSLKDVVPPAIANLAASGPAGAPPVGGLMSGATDSALDKIPSSIKKEMSDFAVNGQYKRNGGSVSSNTGTEEGFSFPGMGGAPAEQGGSEVVEFADTAVSRADVRNTPEVAIFDIISNRYRSSAWKRLDTEGK